MSVDYTAALKAYDATLRDFGVDKAGSAPGGAAPEGGMSFADMVGEGLQSAVEASRHAEEMSLKGIAGQAELTDVVAAVTNAEVMLQTVVTVRDRVLQAYQDVMRMPI
ncbi:MAG: flagellar hook-basal body complex protein FliE [Alphaproteobacteria bacterium]